MWIAAVSKSSTEDQASFFFFFARCCMKKKGNKKGNNLNSFKHSIFKKHTLKKFNRKKRNWGRMSLRVPISGRLHREGQKQRWVEDMALCSGILEGCSTCRTIPVQDTVQLLSCLSPSASCVWFRLSHEFCVLLSKHAFTSSSSDTASHLLWHNPSP